MALETQYRYDVVHGGTRDELIKLVNERCEDNWQPHGTMVISANNDYFQPMTCRVMVSRSNEISSSGDNQAPK